MDNIIVTIIGGGFSGTMLAVNLLKKTNKKIVINIIDKNNLFCRGTAYSSFDKMHLLNVQTEKMGAFHDDIEHFYKWLTENQEKWRCEKEYEDLILEKGTFFPRWLYGSYLEDIFNEYAKSNKVRKITSEVVDIHFSNENKSSNIVLENGEKIESNVVIIATGNEPPTEVSGWLNPWKLDNKDILNKGYLSTFSKEDSIGIVGSGLTMVDIVMTLYNNEFKGRIYAYSKSSRLPQPHLASYQPYSGDFKPLEYNKLIDLISKFKAELKKGTHDWRALIDYLRPNTPEIWKKLSLKDKRIFIARLFNIWNTHRHRMPQQSHEIVNQLIRSGQLALVNKRLTGNENLGHKLIINCTGPSLNISKTKNKLIRNLVDKGVVELSSLSMGIKLIRSDSFKVSNERPIYAMGTPIFSEYLETTAVPELRVQAHLVAEEVLQSLQNTN